MENDADILLYNTEWGEVNIKEELNRTIAKRQSIVDEISELEMRKQELLQEALRLDRVRRLGLMSRDIVANLILVGFSIALLYLFLKVAITGIYWLGEPNKIILGSEIAMVVGTLGLGIERVIKHWR